MSGERGRERERERERPSPHSPLRRREEEPAEKCRKLFRQAVNSVTDDIGHVCEAFLQFEREEGTLESFEAALTRTEAQLGRLKERQEKVILDGSVCQCDLIWWE